MDFSKQQVLLFLLLTLISFSCRKDEIYNSKVESALSIEAAKDWFSDLNFFSDFRLRGSNDTLPIQPDWLNARIIKYQNSIDVVSVPVHQQMLSDAITRLIVYQDSCGGMDARLLFFIPDSSSIATGNFTVNNFSGYSFMIDNTGSVIDLLYYQNGHIDFLLTPKDTSGIPSTGINQRNPWLPWTWWPTSCNNAGGGTTKKGTFWRDVDNWWGNFFEEQKGSTDIFSVFIPNFLGSGYVFFPNILGGGGGGGGNNLNQFFDDDIFDTPLINDLIAECSYSKPEDIPLTIITQQWGNQSNGALWAANLNKCYEQWLVDPTQSFSEIVANHQIDELKPPGIPNSPRTVGAWAHVYAEMVNSVVGCKNKFPGATASMGSDEVLITSEEMCDCLKNYNSDDALVGFLKHYHDISKAEAEFLKNHSEYIAFDVEYKELIKDCNIYNFDYDDCVLNELVSSLETLSVDDDEDLNTCEKALILNNKICAMKIYFNRDKAFKETISRFGFNGRNDCSDAFRHAYFNALNTLSCSADVAKEFGDAHECEPVPPDKLSEKEMDLNNNEKGRQVVLSNPKASLKKIADIICSAIKNGDLLVLQDPQNGNSTLIDSNGCECNK